MSITSTQVRSAETDSDSTATVNEVCQVLAGVLRDGIDIHRCAAAQALGRLGGVGAFDPLLAALLDEDEDVRYDAAEALLHLNDSRAGTQLLENLIGDPNSNVKGAAIKALARFGHIEVVDWLRRIVRGRAEEIVWDQDAFYDGGWDDWLDLQIDAIEALAELGVEAAVPDIVDAIQLEDGQDLTAVGFKALARLGEPGAEALAQFFETGDNRLRRRVVFALDGADSRAAADMLTRALGDAAVDVRLAALSRIAEHTPDDERLAALFHDPVAKVRAEAVRLCGAEHATLAGDLLNDKAEVVQIAVLELLVARPGLVEAETLVDQLQEKFHSGPPDLARAAAPALVAVVPEIARKELLAGLANDTLPSVVRVAAMDGLAALSGDGVGQALVNALGDDERQVRVQATAKLTNLAARGEWPNAHGEALLAALRGDLVPAPDEPEKESEHATASADTVEEAEDEKLEPAFPTSTLEAISATGPASGDVIEAKEDVQLTDEDMEFLSLSSKRLRKKVVPLTPSIAAHEDVPRLAARFLGDIANEEVAVALAGVFASGDHETCLYAADSLFRIGERLGALPEKAIDAMIGQLVSSDRDLRVHIIRALGVVQSPRPVMTLINCLADQDSFVRKEAIVALSRLDAAGANIARFMTDPDPSVRLAAAEAVTIQGSPETVEDLVEFALAFEGYHCREVGCLLRATYPAAAANYLAEIIKNPDRLRVRQPAIQALGELYGPDTVTEYSPPLSNHPTGA